jgi:hypothetical protein
MLHHKLLHEICLRFGFASCNTKGMLITILSSFRTIDCSSDSLVHRRTIPTHSSLRDPLGYKSRAFSVLRTHSEPLYFLSFLSALIRPHIDLQFDK